MKYLLHEIYHNSKKIIELLENKIFSVNNIPVRLTDERWNHIVENHNEMAGYFYDVLETVVKPDWIFLGNNKELWAVKNIFEKKYILVIYKEIKDKNDGFIITAFFTTQIKKIQRRKIIWQQQK